MLATSQVPAAPPIAPRAASFPRRGTRVAGALVAYATLLVVWILAAGGPDKARWTNVLTLPVGFATAFLLLRLRGHPSIDARSAQAWTLVGLAYLAGALGDVAWTVVESGLGANPAGTWVDAPYLAFYPLVVAGLLRMPLPRRADGVAFVLDVAAATVAGVMAVGYFVVRPAVAAGDLTSANLLPAAYPVGDVVVLAALARLGTRRTPGGARRPLDLLAVALLLDLVGNIVWAVLAAEGGYATGGFADACWVVCYAVTGVAAADAANRPSVQAPAPDAVAPDFAWTPYLGMVAGFAIVVGVALFGRADDLPPLVVGAVVLSGAVVARQVRAVRRTVSLEAAVAARASERRFRTLVQHSTDAVVVLSPDGVVQWVAASSRSVLGAEPPELLGRRLAQLAHGDDDEAVEGFVRAALGTSGRSGPLTWRCRRPDGTHVLLETFVTNLVADPAVAGLVANSRDVTERKALEEELSRRAFHDSLTGLPNRALFLDRVEHAVARSPRRGGTVYVLFLDLDHFKSVNDTFGHDVGDQVLMAAAERLGGCLRDGDTAARLGGDEFGVLLDDCATEAVALDVAARITEAFHAPFVVDGREVFATASVGLAAAAAGTSGDVALRNADDAMFVAKRNGGARREAYRPRMHADTLAQLELRADLYHAVERGQLRLDYQPIVTLADGRPCGAEALLRWQHPTRGLLLPATFLPLAEQSGLILPIGAWVLERACQDARRWRGLAAGPAPYVAVNVSTRQLQGPSLVGQVVAALAAADLPPSALTLELTWGGLVQDPAGARRTLKALRDLGVRVAVDDCGTAPTSLAHLGTLPLDALKLSKALVDGLGRGPAGSRPAHAVLSAASLLGLDVVATGIETPAQVERLLELGCRFGQGHLFARPLDADAVGAAFDAPSSPPA